MKILSFTPPIGHRAAKLLQISNELDALILKHLADPQVESKELLALIAHRFGSLLKNVGERQELWDFCEKIIKEQGAL